MIGLPDVKKFIKNHDAVSDVMGEILMTIIAVLLVSSIAVSIFSYDVVDDIPRVQVKEWANVQADTINLKHSGGEFIETEAFEIVVNINGDRYVYSSSDINSTLGRNIWELGDTIEIDTNNEWGIGITEDDEITVFLVDIPSKKVIQNLELSSGESTNSDWIAPQGSAEDTSAGGSATLLDIQEEGDGLFTHYYPLNTSNSSIYEEFDFDANPTLWGILPGSNFSSVTLKLVYRTNNNSCEDIKLKIWDEDPSRIWNEEDLTTYDSFTVYSTDLSAYINNTMDLANIKVQLVATGNASISGQKSLNVDYIALRVS